MQAEHAAVGGIDTTALGREPVARPHRRIADIEVLRGVAVISVVVQHAHGNLFMHCPAWVEYFFAHFAWWFGVDLFFAISGFVIARDLVPTLNRCRSHTEFFLHACSFWIRRAFRLLPSAWLWLALMLLASAIFNQAGYFGSVRTNLAATLAGVLNFANFRFADCFFKYPYGSSFAYWSLSLEEQFYLLFPVLIFLCRRWLAGILLVSIVLQFCLLRTPLLMVVRTDALMLGVLLAMTEGQAIYRKFQPVFLSHSRLIRVLVVLLLLAIMGMMASDVFGQFRFRVGIIALCSASLVWLASYDRNYIMGDSLLKRCLLYVGSRSYAIYLIHVPTFFFVREMAYRWLHGADPASWQMNLGLALSTFAVLVSLSELNYRYIETPLRVQGKRLAGRLRVPATQFIAQPG